MGHVLVFIWIWFLLMQSTSCNIDLYCNQLIGYFENFRCVTEHSFGQGAFGAAYLVTNGDYDLVVKVARLDNDEDLIRAANELNLLLLCKHTNIIHLKDWFRDNIFQYLVLEFAEAGSLTDFMQSELFRRTPVKFILGIFLKILSGIDHVHSLGYVHGDIKTHNIVFGIGYEPQIIDFDLATTRFGWGLMKGNSVYTEPRIIFPTV